MGVSPSLSHKKIQYHTMNFLTLEDIKSQIVMDADYHDEDTYLESLGDTAEQLVEKQIDDNLYDVVGENEGELPKPLLHAMKMIVEYLYDNRGSAENDIPECYFYLCRLYRNYH